MRKPKEKVMLYLSIALFAVAAVFGVTILAKWMTQKDAPKSVVYSHGLFAAVALVILIIYGFQHPENYPKVSIILFIIAALGGFYMFLRDVQKKNSPMGLALIHGVLAVGAFVALLISVFA